MAARTTDDTIGGGIGGGLPRATPNVEGAQTIDGFAAFLDGNSLGVPANFDLLNADFARIGADLVLTAPDGSVLVITDYFALPLHPDLSTHEGAVLPAHIVAVLAGPQAPGQYAQAGANDAAAQQVIGEVKTVQGRVVVTHADGTSVEATTGTPIYAQDVVETALDGAVGILFVDDTSFALGGNARMVMDKFVYDPAAKDNSGVLSVVQGAFSFVSGQVAKSGDDALTVETPSLTIGVRGTAVFGKAQAQGATTYVGLTRDPNGDLGKIFVSNDLEGFLITKENQAVSSTGRDQNITPPHILTLDQIKNLAGLPLSMLPSPDGKNWVRDEGNPVPREDGGTASNYVSDAGEGGMGFASGRDAGFTGFDFGGDRRPSFTPNGPAPKGFVLPSESGTNDRVYGGEGRVLAQPGTYSTQGLGNKDASDPINTPGQPFTPPPPQPNGFITAKLSGGVASGQGLNTDTSTFTDNNDGPPAATPPAPIISGPTSINFPEAGGLVLASYTTSSESGTPAFLSIGPGGDGGQFQLISGAAFITTTTLLAFAEVPDFENPGDADGNNIYEVTLLADDGQGNTQSIVVTISVADVDESPTIDGADALNVAENGLFVGNFTATAFGGDPADISVGVGDDSALFTFDDGSDSLLFIAAPDFENPLGGPGGNSNNYTVNLVTDDGQGNQGAFSVSVTVTDLDETPIFSVPASPTILENTTAVSGTFTATDYQGNPLDITISKTIDDAVLGFGDNAFFDISNANGALSFVDIQPDPLDEFPPTPDFENPVDFADGVDGATNNIFTIRLSAVDANGNRGSQIVSIQVLDENEAPFFAGNPSSLSFDIDEGQTETFSPIVSDPENAQLTFALTGFDAQFFELVDPHSSSFRFVDTPNFEDELDVTGGDNVFEFELSATDGTHTVAVPITVDLQNVAPSFIAPSPFAGVLENTTAVGTFAAADPAGGNVTFAFAGGADDDFFFLNSSTGVLTFRAAPDFETPQDDGTDNSYNVRLSVSDGRGGVALHDLIVQITNVNEAPIEGITDFALTEGVPFSSPLFPSDPEGDSVTVTLVGGPDLLNGDNQPLFSIVNNQLKAEFTPDFENPQDANGDNFYNITVNLSDGVNNTLSNITIEISNVNEPPVFAGGVTSLSFNTLEGQQETFTHQVADPEGAPVTFSITGADAARFELLDPNGIDFRFIAPPDFEAPGDLGTNNVYDITITADDGTFQIQMPVTVTVGNVNEPPVPVGGSAFSVPENTASNLVTFIDPDTGTAATIVGIDAAGGEDGNRFSVFGGVFRFASRPDFENPTDANQDQEYLVTVIVNDPSTGNDVNVDLAITVTPVDEPPELQSQFTYSVNENVVGGLGVQTEDPETNAPGTLTIIGGADQALFQIVNNDLQFIAPPDFETPQDSADAFGQVAGDNVYSVRLEAIDDGNQIVQFSQTITILNVEELPVPVGGSAFSVPENTAGGLVTFTDPDTGNTATIVDVDPGGLADSNRFFVIGGELRFQTPPDFEAPTDADLNQEYLVTVIVNDPSLEEDVNIDLAITVTPVDEPPIVLSNSNITIDENFPGFIGLDIEDPEGGSITITNIGGPDGALFSNGFTDIRFTNGPDFENPADVGTDNVYEVLLTIEDAGGNETQFLQSVTVENLEEQPQVVGGPNITLDENHTGRVVTIIDPDTGEDVQLSSIPSEGVGIQPDGIFFEIVNNEILFVDPPDFENPVDDTHQENNAGADGVPDNVYSITVFLRDTTAPGVGHRRDIHITIADVEEAPQLVGLESFSVPENFTGSLIDVIDPEGEGVTLSFPGESIDQDDFEIVDGELRFIAPPDFENPVDDNLNNIYQVSVRATDGSAAQLFTDFLLTITVTDIPVEQFLLSDLDGTNGFGVSPGDARTQFGGHVSMGDFDGDGFSDIQIGAPRAVEAGFIGGESSVYYGGLSPFGGAGVINAGLLTIADGFILRAATNQSDGYPLSGVGLFDVNNDGKADALNTVQGGTIEILNEGLSGVQLGGARPAANVDILADSPGEEGLLVGGVAGGYFAALTAGDFNGDGYEDIVFRNGEDIGAVDNDVVILFGQQDLIVDQSIVDVNGATNSLTLTGFDSQGRIGQNGQSFSQPSAAIGDVNGDRIGDLILGDPLANGGEGQVYVIFGAANGLPATLDVSTLDGTNGFRVDAGFESRLGSSVAYLGDVDGDGQGDFIVGAPGFGLNPVDEAYLFYGRSNFQSVIDLDPTIAIPFVFDGTNGTRFTFDGTEDRFGTSVAAAGDVDGDGVTDILIGAPNDGDLNEGVAILIFGDPAGFGGSLEVSAPEGQTGLRMVGESGSSAGKAVAGGQDINGDGLDDMIVGASYHQGGDGKAYIVYGDVLRSSATHMGTSAGEDIFGDGNANIIIGAQGDDRLFGNGGADVLKGGQGDDRLFGQEGQKRLEGDSGFDTVEFLGLNGDVLNLLPTPVGGGAIEFFGLLKEVEVLDFDANGGTDIRIDALAVQEITDTRNELRIIGDVADILTLGDAGWVFTSATTFDGTLFKVLEKQGTTLVVQDDITLAGAVVETPTFFLSDIDGLNGFVIDGGQAGERFASHMSFDDFSGDGFADIQISHPGDPRGAGYKNAGKVYVVYGGEDPFAGARVTDIDSLDLSQAFTTTADDQGADAEALSGNGLRDVNNDGAADSLTFIRDANFSSPREGLSAIEFGGQVQPHHANVHGDALGFQGLFRGGEGARENTLATVGDLNADGYEDFIFRIGDNTGEGDNEVVIVFGDPQRFTEEARESVSTQPGRITLTGFDTYGSIGLSIGASEIHTAATGDINGDQIADLIISDHQANDGDGAVYVVFGNASGFSDLDVTTLNGTNGFRIDGAASTRLGQSIAFLGDVNGDGIGDFVVGAPNSVAEGSPGAAYLVLGSAAPFAPVIDLGTTPNFFDGTNGTRFEYGAGGQAYLGQSVAAGGDVNGDGLNDIVLGAPYASPEEGTYYSGAVYIVYGNAAGLGASFDVSAPNPATHFAVLGLSYDRAGNFVTGGADVNGDGFDDVGTYSYYYGYSGGGAYIIFGGDQGNGATHQGTSADDLITGTVGDDVIIGAQGSDTLDGAGGADVLKGGQGDDTIFAYAETVSIEGDTGFDIVSFVGVNGSTVNLRPAPLVGAIDFFNTLHDVEMLDFTEAGNSTLRLDALTVQQITDTSNDLRITGNIGDTVHFADTGWEMVRKVEFDGTVFQEITSDGRTLFVQQGLSLAGQVPTNTAPTFPVVGPFSLNMDEGLAFVIPAAATDPEGGDITYFIEGADADRFFVKPFDPLNPVDTIGNSVEFLRPPDFEDPQDVGADNIYNITVRAVDDFGLSSTLDLIITVDDVVEATPFITLDDIDGTNGFVFEGPNSGPGDNTGITFTGGEDFNGDGIEDVVIVDSGFLRFGSPTYGAAIGIFGFATTPAALGDGVLSFDEVNLNTPELGFVIRGEDEGDQLANARFIGDMNGDGKSELLVSMPGGDKELGPGQTTQEGDAWIIDGTDTQVNTYYSPYEYNGTRLSGKAVGDGLGLAIAGSGDFNGDGFTDVVISAEAQHNAPGDMRSGEFYVVFGHENRLATDFDFFLATLHLEELDGANGFAVQVTGRDSNLGNDIAFAGDINGDGFDDIIVNGLRRQLDTNNDGVTDFDVNGAMVLFGSGAPQDAVIDADTLGEDEAAFINLNRNTFVVAAGGDMNGDGFDDFVVSDPLYGQVFVVFGEYDLGGDIHPGQLFDYSNDVSGFSVRGIRPSTDFGTPMAFGDFNGDGFDDLMIGSMDFAATDRFHIIFGTEEDFGGEFNLANMQRNSYSGGPGDGIIIEGSTQSGPFGIGEIGFADVNNDGFDDALIGQPADNKGFVVFGSDVGAFGDVVRGTSGADTLAVENGRHAVFGLNGADRIEVTLSNFSNTFRLVDGGGGELDVLHVTNGGDISLDDGNHRIQNFEIIDLSNGAANTLFLSPQDIARQSPGTNHLYVVGDEAGGLDQIVSHDQWVQMAPPTQAGPNGEILTAYRSGEITLLVEAGLDISTFDVTDFGQEARFDGNGFAKFDAAPVDDGPLTVMLWAKVTDDTATRNTQMGLFSIGNGNGDLLTFGLDTFNVNTIDLDLEVFGAGSRQAAIRRESNADSPQSDTNVWHHYAVVFDDLNGNGNYETNEATIYFDGQRMLFNNDINSGNIDFTQGVSLVLGAKIATNDGSAFTDAEHLFEGAMDDVAIFNRALTSTEISTIARSISPLNYTGNDLIDYYSFDTGNLNDNSSSAVGAGNGHSIGSLAAFGTSTVPDLAVPPNAAPFYATNPPASDGSPINVAIEEGTTLAYRDLGFDPEGGNFTYTIMGADKEQFVKTASFANPPDVPSTRGDTIKFLRTPDAEAPLDGGADNIYNITVRVEDDLGDFTDHDLIITVIDVAEVAPDLDLATLNATQGFVIQGPTFGSGLDRTGISFVGGEDFNGDGIDDLVIVNDRIDVGAGGDYGEAMVLFGFNNLPTALDDNVFTRTEIRQAGVGLTITAPDQNDQLNHAHFVGDMNGDGRSELALGVIGADEPTGGDNTTVGQRGHGEVWLVNGGTTNNLTNAPSGTTGTRFIGAESDDHLGWSVGGSGDFNGDGLTDLVMTADAQHSTSGDQRSGEFYVVFGHKNGFVGDFFNGTGYDLSDLDGGTGIAVRVQGLQSDLGENISFGGDINGDGYDDIIASGIRRFVDLDGDGTSILEQEGAVIFFGTAEGLPAINDLTITDAGQIDPTRTAFIQLDQFTDTVSTGGDINGDGFDDFVVTSDAFAGQVAVIFGSDNLPTEINPDQILNGTGEVEGFVVNGLNNDADLGAAVAFGDMNGDGFDDLLITETSISSLTPDRFYVIFGSSETFDTQFNLATMKRSTTSTTKDGLFILSDSSAGSRSIDQVGFADINNDGLDDALIGAPGDNKGYVVYGSAIGQDTSLIRTDNLDNTINLTGGRDSVLALGGNDTINTPLSDFANTFRLIDGGPGNDTIVVTTAGDLDIGSTDHIIRNVQTIDFDNGLANTISVTKRDIGELNPNSHFLTVRGDDQDAIIADGTWIDIGNAPFDPFLNTYRSGDVFLYVDFDVDRSGITTDSFGNEMAFNGTGALRAGNAPVSDGPLTIMMYAAVRAGAAANDQMALFSIGGPDGVDLLTFGLDSFAANTFDLDLDVGTSGLQTQSPVNPQTDGDVWHHYAVVFDDVNENGTYESSEVAIYFDGQRMVSEFASASSVIDFSQATSLVVGAEILSNDGATVGDLENFFNGFMDEVAVFDRALTAAEIAQYTRDLTPLQGDEAGLVDYYTFDDNSFDDQSFSAAGAGNMAAVGGNQGIFFSTVADVPSGA